MLMPIDLDALSWDVDDIGGSKAEVVVDLPPGVTVTGAGQLVWGAIKLHVDPKTGNRSCVWSCEMDPTFAMPNHILWSNTNAEGKIDDCPAASCDFEPLSVSPTPALATNYGNDKQDYRITLIGTTP